MSANRPKISSLAVPDPDDCQQIARDALCLMDEALPVTSGLQEAHAALVHRYKVLYGCIECGGRRGHKFDCYRTIRTTERTES